MDITPKYVGIASGLMNAGSAVADIISPIAFGIIIDKTGNWSLPFYGSVALLDMLTSEQHRCSNEKKKFQRRV
ncbi:MAG: hypothetical protein E6Z29_03455 [Escherichia coli]|nr:hypothetical protein [Escherichia coli]